MESSNFYSQIEKIQICTDITIKLKYLYSIDCVKVNLFNDEYSFVKELKKIFNDYIHNDTNFKGSLAFIEIGKKIEYHFPLTKNYDPFFVIKD